MMANSARDPYWQAAVRREVIDHPAAQARSRTSARPATCRWRASNPRHEASSGAGIREPRYVAGASRSRDGVSCTVCHQIAAENLGQPCEFRRRFRDRAGAAPGERHSSVRTRSTRRKQSVMHSATSFVQTETTHIQQSELCATCHTLYTTALDAAGKDRRAARASPVSGMAAQRISRHASCQSCHMPEVAGETPIASVLGQPRPRLSQHTFRGGNAFMFRILTSIDPSSVSSRCRRSSMPPCTRRRSISAVAAATMTIESAELTGD